MDKRSVSFGYYPPSGLRGIERFDPKTFVRDLERVLEFATQHFSPIWVADHLMMGQQFRMDAWTQLTWMAARFPDARLGTLVLASSFRHPPLLAKMAATLQTFSRGRFTMGLGAGWSEPEFHAYGYEFPRPRVRIAQMVDAIKVMRTLWTSAPATYVGKYYQVRDAYCEPLIDPPPPIMIGGGGEQFLLRAVAEHADQWNTRIRPVDELRRKQTLLDQYCHDAGRDPGQVRRTMTRMLFLAPSAPEATRWAGDRAKHPEQPFVGDPPALVEHLHEMVELGFHEFELVFAGFPETNDMRLFVERVLPAFR